MLKGKILTYCMFMQSAFVCFLHNHKYDGKVIAHRQFLPNNQL
jgi:hypothetical protein